jgi:probable HAF family extracellular repeat protein
MINLGSNVPTAIGNSGLVTGWGGFLYQNGQMMTGLPSGTGAYGYAINGSGEVVGSFGAPNGQGGGTGHAFLFQDVHMVDLGVLLGTSRSVAMGINSLGWMVGDYTSTSGPDGSLNRAFLYQNGTMTDLNSLIPTSSGWFFTGAVAINNKGQILATGVGPDGSWAGDQDAFLLTPITALQVPEPSTLAFFGVAAIRLAFRHAWRRR